MGVVHPCAMSTGVALTRVETRSLYRALLKAALTFPSKRRANIVTEIRTEFRANSLETEPVAIKAMIKEAEHALFELARFGVGGKDSTASGDSWTYTQVS